MKSHGNWRVVPREWPKEWPLKFAVVFLAFAWLMIVASSWAEAAEGEDGEPNAPAASSDDEYSFKWLDPDKKIYVLQNRKYLKANRPMLSVMWGPGISSSFRDNHGVGFRGAYYFSESLGIEAFYTAAFNKENQTFEALKTASPTARPIVREIRGQTGLLLKWVPWYAKINVFNSILYFDWYFTAGAGQVRTALDTRTSISSPASYSEESLTSLYLGTGHLFHLSQLMSVRLDLTGAYYKAPNLGNTGASTWFSNYMFGFGFGLKL